MFGWWPENSLQSLKGLPRLRILTRILLLLVLSLSASAQYGNLQALVPELALRTSLADDYGTLLEAVVFRGVEYKPSEASEKILPQLNWATRDDRLELGQAWIETIVLFDSEVIRPGDERFPELDGPKAIILPDGTVRYTAWAVYMRGRLPGSARTLWQVDIGPDGGIGKTPLKAFDPTRPYFPPRSNLLPTGD